MAVIIFGFYGTLTFLMGFVFFRWPTAPFQYMMMFDDYALSGQKRTRIRSFGALCMILGILIVVTGLVDEIIL